MALGTKPQEVPKLHTEIHGGGTDVYIYRGVKEQRVRDLIDQLPDESHTLEKYLYIGENYDVTMINAKTFQAHNSQSAVINAINKQFSKQSKQPY